MMEEQWQANKVIGIIGLGDMGLLYATKFSSAGWKVVACDREELFDSLSERKRQNAWKFDIVKMVIMFQESVIILFTVSKPRTLINW